VSSPKLSRRSLLRLRLGDLAPGPAGDEARGRRPASPALEHRRRLRRALAAPGSSALDRALVPVARRLVRDTQTAAGQRVLVLVCDDGAAALAAAQAGAEVTACGPVDEALERLRRRAARAAVTLETCRAEPDALPFDPAAFDRVLSGFGVTHEPWPMQIAAELLRVLAPDGRAGIAYWLPGAAPLQAAVLARRLAPLGAGVPRPEVWGRYETLYRLFLGAPGDFHEAERSVALRFGDEQAAAEALLHARGPVADALAHEPDAARRDGLEEEVRALVARTFAPAGDAVVARAPYGVVVTGAPPPPDDAA